MKKIGVFILMILPVSVFGQVGNHLFDEMSDGQTKSIQATYSTLPEKDSCRYIVMDSDTLWEKKDTLLFYQAVIRKAFSDNVVMKVCSVSFGLHYEFVRYILEKHYGQPVYHVPGHILYKDIFYDGEQFDDISFIFQKDDNEDCYLNQIIFIKNAATHAAAVQIKNTLQEELSWHYSSIVTVDDELTVGGLPPATFLSVNKEANPITTVEMGFGFEIRILSPEECGSPYYVMVKYGPYKNN